MPPCCRLAVLFFPFPSITIVMPHCTGSCGGGGGAGALRQRWLEEKWEAAAAPGRWMDGGSGGRISTAAAAAATSARTPHGAGAGVTAFAAAEPSVHGATHRPTGPRVSRLLLPGEGLRAVVSYSFFSFFITAAKTVSVWSQPPETRNSARPASSSAARSPGSAGACCCCCCCECLCACACACARSSPPQKLMSVVAAPPHDDTASACALKAEVRPRPYA